MIAATGGRQTRERRIDSSFDASRERAADVTNVSRLTGERFSIRETKNKDESEGSKAQQLVSGQQLLKFFNPKLRTETRFRLGPWRLCSSLTLGLREAIILGLARLDACS